MKKITLSLLYLTFLINLNFSSKAILSLQGNTHFSNLSKEEFLKIKNNKFVMKNNNIKDHTWPEIYLYFIIDASPLESVAVFYALEHQKDYTPNLIKSTIIKQISPTEVYTSYELKMPWPLDNGKYIHGSTISRYTNSGYQVSWYMVKSNITTKVNGDAIFLKLGEKTLVRYRAIVIPKSFFARFIKSKILADIKNTLIAIKKEVYALKKKKGKYLEGFIDFINTSLANKKYYLKQKK